MQLSNSSTYWILLVYTQQNAKHLIHSMDFVLAETDLTNSVYSPSYMLHLVHNKIIFITVNNNKYNNVLHHVDRSE